MVQTHNLGFPRIGRQRELKFVLESYWQGKIDLESLLTQAKAVRLENWKYQDNCDWVPVGDFSLYDQILDTSFLLGHIPQRVTNSSGTELDYYFRVARGRSPIDGTNAHFHAGEMTKWFDTNYHYIVPELSRETQFKLNPQRLLTQINEAKAANRKIKPVIVGPLTYLWLSKCKDDSEQLDYLEALLPIYSELFLLLAEQGIEWVQVDEPILVTELSQRWKSAFESSYHQLQTPPLKVMMTTYFGQLKENLKLACDLPVAGLHIDAINAHEEVRQVLDWLPALKVLSLGVINGRNIWKADLTATLDWLEPIAKKLGNRLWLAPSCSLLHVPVDLTLEEKLDPEIKHWLAFALQKLDELNLLQLAINHGRESVQERIADNAAAILARKTSLRVHKVGVKRAVQAISQTLGRRKSTYPQRAAIQRQRFQLPLFPTTTIGSFPQTQEIRQARLLFKKGQLKQADYIAAMQKEITRSVHEQEKIGLDVLVHGEAERNDMVEYFGEQLDGYAFTEHGWVQSYGSRCVKPPVLFGDIHRPQAMAVEWTLYAQSLTKKPVKGMLTGAVTILNWSFVRDDQPRRETCYQLALAIREEVLDLEKAGVAIIQIDEPALREGLPLRQSQWQDYLNWAVESFRICANGVQDQTQIHTHMCYSEFNDIIQSIADLDADVITIETARSDMELLNVFDEFQYPNDIGPGVYDIHSPNIPDIQKMVGLMSKAAQRIPVERLWVNPDCGLKTRRWEEVIPSLKNMVQAAQQLRESSANQFSESSANQLSESSVIV